MTATVIPIHRNTTRDLSPDVVMNVHALWESFEKVPPEERAYHREWLERMYGLGASFDEAITAMELREQAQQDLDDHPDPA